jgi:hypothetical protein
MSEKAASAVNQVPAAQFNAVSGADDYFQTVVINALLVILKDQALSSHHHTVIDAVMSIFKTQGLKCATFLPQVCWPAAFYCPFYTWISLDHPCLHFCYPYCFCCPVAGVPSTTTRYFGWNHQATGPELYARNLRPDY